MENNQLRKFFKMKPTQTGVLVCNVPKFHPNFHVLKKDDVILEIDGIKIASDASIPFRKRGNIIYRR